MTPKYPGAFWRPTDDAGALPGPAQIGTMHEAVSANPTSVFGWVQTAYSCHGYVGKNGYTEQYINFDRRAYGVSDGNNRCLTWESYDGLQPITDASGYREVQRDDPAIYGRDANSGRWDPGQCERFADIIAWSEVNLDIPIQEIPDSLPGRRGWAPHRWGIAPWRAAGGERWTSHDGKPCPGDLRVAQIPGIIARAKVIAAAVRAGTTTWLLPGEVDLATDPLRGAGSQPPTPLPTPAPTGESSDAMYAVFYPQTGGIGVTQVGSGVWRGLTPTAWAALQAAHKAAGIRYLDFGKLSDLDIRVLVGKQVAP